ncbi:hypothetical protein PENTCL1PPCAC_4934, partial [Pristionchus entomophagus]
IIEYLAHIVASKTALAYCRVCDNVFRTVDAFYTHIQSPAHMEMNMKDSMPLFEVDETLTRNQLIAR